jgi:uncharacterized radical SAM superfamily Fe-S cluster-containing enzyme
MPVRPYIFYDHTLCLCSQCKRKIEGKIVFQDEQVFLLKRCPTHGHERVLIAEDIPYYKKAREQFLKPPDLPLHFNTPILYGCPYDCGLCPDHEQHSCLSIIEVTDACNLKCPICYAESGPHRPGFRSMAQIEAMMDAVVRNEGEPDVVQISGGEPTIHPDFFAIIDAARARPIRHLMINTNGVKIAKDPAFVERLAAYGSGIEIYLQFDSFEAEALITLRGEDLREVRTQAIANLNEHNLSTTLVVTLQKGLNDHEMGAIVDYALKQRCVRGVTFQPIQAVGRLEGYDPARDRLTLTGVRRKLLEQSDVFQPDDVLPVPCHPDCIAMAYALKLEDQVVPLTGLIPLEALLEGPANTISFEKDPAIRAQMNKLFSTDHSPESGATALKELLCCMPTVGAPKDWGYDKLFRIIIMQFMDAYDMDIRSVKKSCVHFVHPEDGRLIPFDTYNLLYRDQLETEVLDPIRAEISTPCPAK